MCVCFFVDFVIDSFTDLIFGTAAPPCGVSMLLYIDEAAKECHYFIHTTQLSISLLNEVINHSRRQWTLSHKTIPDCTNMMSS